MSALRVLVIGAIGLVMTAVLMAAAIGVVSASVAGSGGSGASGGEGSGGGAGGSGGVVGDVVGDGAPSATATIEIPEVMLTLYRDASATCQGLPWTVLAAIGTVESGNGTSNLPGVHSGANAAGAEGPMQFEPGTFARRHMSQSPLTRDLPCSIGLGVSPAGT
jgi:hypothetical protein